LRSESLSRTVAVSCTSRRYEIGKTGRPVSHHDHGDSIGAVAVGLAAEMSSPPSEVLSSTPADRSSALEVSRTLAIATRAIALIRRPAGCPNIASSVSTPPRHGRQ